MSPTATLLVRGPERRPLSQRCFPCSVFLLLFLHSAARGATFLLPFSPYPRIFPARGLLFTAYSPEQEESGLDAAGDPQLEKPLRRSRCHHSVLAAGRYSFLTPASCGPAPGHSVCQALTLTPGTSMLLTLPALGSGISRPAGREESQKPEAAGYLPSGCCGPATRLHTWLLRYVNKHAFLSWAQNFTRHQ